MLWYFLEWSIECCYVYINMQRFSPINFCRNYLLFVIISSNFLILFLVLFFFSCTEMFSIWEILSKLLSCKWCQTWKYTYVGISWSSVFMNNRKTRWPPVFKVLAPQMKKKETRKRNEVCFAIKKKREKNFFPLRLV